MSDDVPPPQSEAPASDQSQAHQSDRQTTTTDTQQKLPEREIEIHTLHRLDGHAEPARDHSTDNSKPGSPKDSDGQVKEQKAGKGDDPLSAGTSSHDADDKGRKAEETGHQQEQPHPSDRQAMAADTQQKPLEKSPGEPSQAHFSDRLATAADNQQKLPEGHAAEAVKTNQTPMNREIEIHTLHRLDGHAEPARDHSTDNSKPGSPKDSDGQTKGQKVGKGDDHLSGGKEPKKDQAEFGGIEKHSKQGSAIRDENNIRLSEHEHIRARINLYLQTHDPKTGTSAYTKSDYRASATLTIPVDIAREKTALDMKLRDQLKNALETGVVSKDLIKQMDIEADIERTMQAKEIAMEKRLAEGKPVEDLTKITREKITEAAHLQQGQVFEGGKRQTSPLQGASEKEINEALKPLEEVEKIAGKVGSVIGTIGDILFVKDIAETLEHFNHPERYPSGTRFTDTLGREWIKSGDMWVNQAYLDSRDGA